MNTNTVTDFQADRYIELWNTNEEEVRRATIRSLWADDGWHVAPSIAVRGYEELEARVARSHQRWIVEEHCRFVKRDAQSHHNAVRIVWEMVDSRGNVESVGSEILVLNDSGKITSAYQFLD
jgi:hypothetical protein